MLGSAHIELARGDNDYVVRVALALDRRRLAATALVALLLSVRPLLSSGPLDFFSPAEVALLWFEHLVELAVIAAALMAVYTLLDEALPRHMPLRLAVVCVGLLGSSALLGLLLYAYYAHGFEHLPPPLRLFSDSLRWGFPAVFLALIADVHQRSLQTDSAADAAEVSRAKLGQGESEQQLALLQAQIEPHFLFNVLGNVRRLYRTQPQAGADAVASLMRYLRGALPQLRSRSGCLGDEIELLRSYLDLFQVRMGTRLTFSIDADPALHEAEFPPMLLVTLVENAIKHGLEPAGGGHVLVRARRHGDLLQLTVLDNGAGFGATASSGTGLGLANVRRQLAARYQKQARLTLEAREPRGASATISMPWRSAQAPEPAPREGPSLEASTGEATMPSQRLSGTQAANADGLMRWLQTHPGSVAMAALLGFAAPVTFFTGDLSAMRDPSAEDLAKLGMWWLLYGLEMWCLLLLAGYGSQRLKPVSGRQQGHGATWLLAACTVTALVSISTAGRASILIEQGVVQSVLTMHLHAFVFSVAMALLYFAHLARSRRQEEAAARLAAAQAGQREAQRRMTQSRLQAVQARIDPQLLFGMLDAVRQSYEIDAPRAERLLDELTAFLRAASPRLRSASSSVARETELARVYAQLHALARANDFGMTIDVSAEARYARFPPGVLLPLLDDALRTCAGPCALSATRTGDDCRLVLSVPARPSEGTVARVRSLLADLYGASGELAAADADSTADIMVKVPYELA
jgi:sensor histidine kinase YesM